MTDHAAIRSRVAAATPGPWVPLGEDAAATFDTRAALEAGEAGYPASLWVDERSLNTLADAEFIAHSREDVPGLLSECDRLRHACKALGALVWMEVDGTDAGSLADVAQTWGIEAGLSKEDVQAIADYEAGLDA